MSARNSLQTLHAMWVLQHKPEAADVAGSGADMENSDSGSVRQGLDEPIRCDRDRKRARFTEEPPARAHVEAGMEGVTSSTSRHSSNKGCPVPWCEQEFNYPKAHVYNFHYPTKLDMENRGRQATKDRLEAIEYLACSLTGRKEAAGEDLMMYINEHNLTAKHQGKKIETWLWQVAQDMAQESRGRCPGSLRLFPINSLALVFHWAVMLEVVSRLDPIQYNVFMQLFSDPGRRTEFRQRLATMELIAAPEYRGQERQEKEGSRMAVVGKSPHGMGNKREPQRVVRIGGEESNRETRRLEAGAWSGNTGERMVSLGSPQSRITRGWEPRFGAFDSHFHMDRLRSKVGVRTWNLRDVEECIWKGSLELEVDLKGAVANFCDPDNYPSIELIRHLNEQGIAVTIGLHPKSAGRASPAILEELSRLLSLPEVIGLGEVGLDHTAPSEEWPMQRDVLADCLAMLESRHVLVLHCRDPRPEAKSDLLASLFYQCSAVIPVDQKIHLHGFDGTGSDLRRWTRHFGNTFVGFTLMVEEAVFGKAQQQAVRTVKSERLLLETDAPYFAPQGMQYSSPSCIGAIAKVVASIRGEEVRAVLQKTLENGRCLYRQ